MYELSVVGLNFETPSEIEKYPDCKYALDTHFCVSILAQRVESLNLVGDMLWPSPIPNFGAFPLSRYDWLTITTDVFLTRHISVLDCCFLLVNTVYRYGLTDRQCTFGGLKSRDLPASLARLLQSMIDEQEVLRHERNARIHHGAERSFTDDDVTFRIASRFKSRGEDRFGRRFSVDRSFKEGLVGLQRDFNRATRTLLTQLDKFYDALSDEFEDHFGPLIAAATHGLNSRSRKS